MEGIITKILAGFYYVDTAQGEICCRARGRLRQQEASPVVGDRVRIQHIGDNLGSVEQVLPRESFLKRPAVANVSQILVMAALQNPAPNLVLLDRLLVTAEHLDLKAVVCLNKADLDNAELRSELGARYRQSGYPTYAISLQTGQGLDSLRSHLAAEVTVLAGQSGAGKSTLINALAGRHTMQTGEVSDKSGTGRHTTRHVELLPVVVGEQRGLMVDTPGFNRLELPPELESSDLDCCFPEMVRLSACRFGYSCAHLEEPGCSVREAVTAGEIAASRYESYQMLYQELVERERRY